ncbi:uncharacterized protein LOC111695282 [Eurytemora carolleeae]|uniref:uncharacterized protein LOC111695282 n=1 Tax=Eurytemora carolleeae TaxID=1294199 RepID=UPI000C77E346|nr:uncharacterized protein LOC111695282 [Eurytemora carolleeae]|eukprot:XP_023320312.1 uncharacterized protein LOC111695282 [Eurytemora affinis]
MIYFLLVLYLSSSTGTGAINIVQYSKDLKGVPGDDESISCSAQYNGDIPSCSWTAPDRTELNENTESDKFKISVATGEGSKNDTVTCTLLIYSLDDSNIGGWNCRFQDNLGSQGKYIFVDLEYGEEILGMKEKYQEQEGRNITLICPSTIRPYDSGSWPVCSWITPAGQIIHIIGRRSEIYEHPEYIQTGNISRGECGIFIKKVGQEHQGKWTCRMISKLTGKILEGRTRLDILKSAPLLDSIIQLRAVELTLSDELILSGRDRIESVYWILRREIELKPEEEFCSKGEVDCVESSNLISEVLYDGRVQYTINVTFSNFSEDDRMYPVVLVIEYINSRRMKKRIQRFVSNGTQEFSSSNIESLSDDNNPGEYSESSIPILEPEQSNEELETQVDLETQDDLEDQDQQNNAKDPDSIEFETSEHNSGIGDHGLTIVKLPDDNEDNDEDFDDDDIGDNDDDDDDYYGEPEYVLVIDERIRKPGGGGKNRRGNKNNERNRQKSSTRCNRRSKSCSVDMFVLEDGESRSVPDYCTVFKCRRGVLQLRRIKNCSFNTRTEYNDVIFPRNQK